MSQLVGLRARLPNSILITRTGTRGSVSVVSVDGPAGIGDTGAGGAGNGGTGGQQRYPFSSGIGIHSGVELDSSITTTTALFDDDKTASLGLSAVVDGVGGGIGGVDSTTSMTMTSSAAHTQTQTQAQAQAQGMGKLEFRVKKVTEKLKSFFLRSGELFRALANGRATAGRKRKGCAKTKKKNNKGNKGNGYGYAHGYGRGGGGAGGHGIIGEYGDDGDERDENDDDEEEEDEEDEHDLFGLEDSLYSGT